MPDVRGHWLEDITYHVWIERQPIDVDGFEDPPQMLAPIWGCHLDGLAERVRRATVEANHFARNSAGRYRYTVRVRSTEIPTLSELERIEANRTHVPSD